LSDIFALLHKNPTVAHFLRVLPDFLTYFILHTDVKKSDFPQENLIFLRKTAA